MIHPVLLCGGSGTRLWPLSRKSFPKQFTHLTGDESLFQASAQRLAGDGFAAPIIVTGEDFRFIVTEQLDATGIAPKSILIEPEGRNTAPAVLAAALAVARDDPEAVILVAPSDHVIPDAGAFQEAVKAGCEAAESGKLVTFGINPTRPETGYGYLELTEARKGGDAKALPLERFVEKPDAESAAKMLTTGKYLWNAGIFLFKARAIIDAFNAHAADMVEPVTKALDDAEADLDFLRLDAAAWAQVPEDSIDFAVMEKAGDLAVVPYDGIWSDLGGWDAVWRDLGPDDQGNVLSDHATAIDCKDSLLRTEADTLEIVGIGLDNIVAVAMNDAVLVADKSRGQDVKKAVEALKAKEAKQATAFPKDHRPWGWFETLALSDRFQVKRIVVKPGGKLSLQSHVHRSEHWIVVSGTAKVTVDDEVNLLTENESVYIPLGAVHRMENPGKVPMVLIEVQTGVYLGEDDIIRYEDVYART